MTPLPSISPLLHIGDDSDARRLIRTARYGGGGWSDRVEDGWHIVHCAKSPWHKDLLGYTSRAAPEGHPERWFADRDRRTYLNLVDSPEQLHELVVPILDHAAVRIDEAIDEGLSVLVHCNMGMSRSPAVCMWWMHKTVPEQPYDEALGELLHDHPFARHDTGIMGIVRNAWGFPCGHCGAPGATENGCAVCGSGPNG